MNPFDYVSSVSGTKQYLFDETSEKEYNTFLVNRAMSYYPDTIFHAQLMNQNGSMDPKMNYDYYFYGIPKKKRYSKWSKPESNSLLDAVKRLYGYGDEKAYDAIKTLSPEQKTSILSFVDEGGARK